MLLAQIRKQILRANVVIPHIKLMSTLQIIRTTATTTSRLKAHYSRVIIYEKYLDD